MRIYLRIEGRVQRVGFRRWIKNKVADIGGVSGFVKNEDDGSVILALEGDEMSVNEVIKQCYKGPMFSRVDKIEQIFSGVFLPSIRDGEFYSL